MWFRETVLCLFLGSMTAYMSEFLNLAESGTKSRSSHTSEQLYVKENRWRLFAEKEQVRACLAPGESASLLWEVWWSCGVKRNRLPGTTVSLFRFCTKNSLQSYRQQRKNPVTAGGNDAKLKILWLKAASEDKSGREECKYCFSSLNSFTSHDISHAKPSW